MASEEHPQEHSSFHSEPEESEPNDSNKMMGLVLTTANSSFSESTCPQCQQRFNKKSHLYRHLREKHEQSREYLCTVDGCDKSFKRGSHLKRHMISHTHEKKFKCLKCIMEFGYKHHLDRHIKIIHDKELFKCEECGAEHSKKKGLAKCKKQHDQAKIRMLKKKEKESGKQIEDLDDNDTIKKTKRIKKESKVEKSVSKHSKSNSFEEKEEIFESSVQNKANIFEDGESNEDRKEDENTNNHKIPVSISNQMHESLQENPSNADTIFNLLKHPNKKEQKCEVMFRCEESGCLNAYSSKSGLRNHMKKVHENTVCSV